MPDLIVILAFLPAALALNLTPGADMMFCLGQGLRNGPRAAVFASAGISVGGIVHVTLAGLGLGAVVARAPMAFAIIRWVGVGYLLFLAWRALAGQEGQNRLGDAPKNAFLAGLWVSLTNPKVILFVLAFIPQFIDPQNAVLVQFLIFGSVFSIGGFMVNAAIGGMASGIGQRLLTSRSANQWMARLSGTIFAGLAVRLAIMEKG